MKKTITLLVFVFASVLAFACTEGAKHKEKPKGKEPQEAGKVIPMNKEMFINNVFDYEKSQEWKYKGDKPAIIDLYADWCGPCRMMAPVMKKLAQQYGDKIVIYKVNVDKERELATLFNATSIPLFVFVPMTGKPQLLQGAADKATYEKTIDEFLLKSKKEE